MMQTQVLHVNYSHVDDFKSCGEELFNSGGGTVVWF